MGAAFLIQGYPLPTKKVTLTKHSGTSIGKVTSLTTAWNLYRGLTSHGYTVGYTISISGCSQTAQNAVVTITHATSSGSFRAVRPTGASTVTATFYGNRILSLPEAYTGVAGRTRITHSSSGFARAANAALVTVYTPGNSIRFTQGGSDPGVAANVGHPVAVGGSFRIEGEVGVNTFKMTQFKASSNATVNVTPYLLEDR